ncbi:hypothetical protein HWV62_36330 [Athelia sp. TMB]|nr:hypothetical protein HWV62_36330 [Athelia sp. TMB]
MPYTPGPPSSPMLAPMTPIEPVDRGLSITPTPTPRSAMLHPANANSNRQESRPKLRKRKSSLSVTTSPMSGIKSPIRNAENALRSVSFMSPSRSRSSSVSGLGIATEETSFAGRMRSGSVGGLFNLKPRRVLRKASAPAPTAPLPALPTAPTQLLPPPKIQIQNTQVPFTESRRPLSNRFHSADNHYALHTHSNITRSTAPESMGSMSLAMAGSGFMNYKSMASSPASPMERDLGMGMTIDEEMKEN